MKLSDIIDYDLSYWNVLGKTGGTALPDNDKPVNVNNIDIWKKHPPFRKEDNKRVEESFGGRGGSQQSVTFHYDIADHEDIGKIGVAEPSKKKPGEYDNWSTPPKDGKSYMTRTKDGRKRKVMVRKTSKSGSVEAMDDEGNHFLPGTTGKISFKKMHLGTPSRSLGSDVKESATHLGKGVVTPPMPGTAELEYDLDHVWDEFKGKDTRADIKTNKKKRQTLKDYLLKRNVVDKHKV